MKRRRPLLVRVGAVDADAQLATADAREEFHHLLCEWIESSGEVRGAGGGGIGQVVAGATKIFVDESELKVGEGHGQVDDWIVCSLEAEERTLVSQQKAKRGFLAFPRPWSTAS